MQEINTILIGLENTLLNQFGDIPPATMSILQDLHEKGCRLGLMSSRSLNWVHRFLQRKRIDDLFSFVIASGGSEYLNLAENRRTVLHTFLPRDAGLLLKQAVDFQGDVADTLRSFPLARAADTGSRYVFDGAGLYSLRFLLFDHTMPPDFHGLASLAPDTEICRLMILGSAPILKRIRNSKALRPCSRQMASGSVLEIFPQGSSIMEAFEMAEKDFGLDRSKTLTFGSNHLEKEILSKTFGIAMKNSTPAIQEAAKRVTKYNPAQNGIAYMINVLLMEKACTFRKAGNGHRQQTPSEESGIVQARF